MPYPIGNGRPGIQSGAVVPHEHAKFDIRHGFHHILAKEEDRLKTAFVLFEGKWQWVRCPMGICDEPATFQRLINMTFQNFVNKTRLTQGMINFCVIVYMNDILVYSETYHGHAQHIEWTLGALRDAGFKIALEKSEFFLSEISFLGYVVTRGGRRPDSRKVTTSTCTEIDEDNCLYPSQALYLEIEVTDLTFWDPIARRNTTQDEEIGGAEEEEEEEEPSSEECDDPDYVSERETGIASGSSQPRKKNKEEEEQRKRKRQETAEGKRPATNVSLIDPSIGDLWCDPESPIEEDDRTAAEGSRRRRKRSESPASFGSPSRSAIRLHQDLGVRASSPVVLSPTP
ncbi:hypothetical protein CBR_g56847 [Chara braunii]|uniref:Reverse transcriptase domain-containing protein n=1 Tax=Chara braunii TaxID=69332 RepID=A0A388MDR3_CHABU|nr:hypothetical protein CBR_g56847 [Chara braunii]|eukprot:GBG92708.1 hypothetical protein CBR_g56847 [Chara braunii]